MVGIIASCYKYTESILSGDKRFNFAGNFQHSVGYINKVFCELQQINFLVGFIITVTILFDFFMCNVV